MLNLRVGYPNREEEKEILRRMAQRHIPEVTPVLSPDDIKEMRDVADKVYLDPKVEDYIIDIVFATREPAMYKLESLEKLIDYGASPRASISRTRVPDRNTRSSGDDGEVFAVAICSVNRHQKACSKFSGRIPSWSGSIRSKIRWASYVP